AVGAHVAAEQPGLAVTDGDVGVLEVHPAVPERLDLGPAQHETGLERFEDLVLMPRAAVGGDDAIFSNALLTCPARAISWGLARAEVAELADALDSGSSARKGVGVRVPASAPTSTTS